MKVIINSDSIYTTYLLRGRLPDELEKLCRVCGEHGITIAIPRTTLLEHQRAQNKHLSTAAAEIRDAFRTLARFGIPYQPVNPDEVLRVPDLPALIRELGAAVEIVEPTIEDYDEAHRRACLHEPPQSPEAKSDEMRDLVIWMNALRVAKGAGGALLVSGDSVHTHQRGDDEARAAGLVRVESLARALESLNVTATPSGALTARLIAAIWPDLIQAGLPLTPEVQVRGLRDVSFTQGRKGPESARFLMALPVRNGEVSAMTVLTLTEGRITDVELSDIRLNGEAFDRPAIRLQVRRDVDLPGTTYDERIGALRAALRTFGGGQ